MSGQESIDPILPEAIDMATLEDEIREFREWLGEPGEEPLHDSHVLMYFGADLAAAGIFEYDIAPCLLCPPTSPDEGPGVILTDEILPWGKMIHLVACGHCGTRGPWGKSESHALELWNAAYKRINGGAAENAISKVEQAKGGA